MMRSGPSDDDATIVLSPLSGLFLRSPRDRCLYAVLLYRFERNHGTPEERRNSRD